MVLIFSSISWKVSAQSSRQAVFEPLLLIIVEGRNFQRDEKAVLRILLEPRRETMPQGGRTWTFGPEYKAFFSIPRIVSRQSWIAGVVNTKVKWLLLRH